MSDAPTKQWPEPQRGILIDPAERRRCEDLVQLVRTEFDRMSPEGRQVFVVMFTREFGDVFRTIHQKLKAKVA